MMTIPLHIQEVVSVQHSFSADRPHLLRVPIPNSVGGFLSLDRLLTVFRSRVRSVR